MKNLFAKMIVTAALVSPFTMVSVAGGLYGTGENIGSGWQSDGMGGTRGTGNNFGSGWQSDEMGGYRGTGNNYGKGWSR